MLRVSAGSILVSARSVMDPPTRFSQQALYYNNSSSNRVKQPTNVEIILQYNK